MGTSGEPQDADLKTVRAPRICVVGPVPPPSGGMANQCEQLVRLLRLEGLEVDLVQSNAAYWPQWIGRVPVVRAGFRFFPYLVRLWEAAGRADVMHILANSGWAWHLFVAPAMLIARMRATPVIVNYRGGNADSFFSQTPGYVLKMLASASMRVTPSVFLQQVFARHGLNAEVIPNVVDLARFSPAQSRPLDDAPHIVVTRNLDSIYDIPTAIRAFSRLKKTFVHARMTIAGSGPELGRLQNLVCELKLDTAVTFTGRIDNVNIGYLYASAHCMINSSTVDNMPNSVLEAFASSVPVVSTRAGGIPDMIEHGVNGLLVPIGDDEALAREVGRVLQNPALAANLTRAGLADAQKCAWPQVRAMWLNAYRRTAASEVV